jgi:hypothetical protein
MLEKILSGSRKLKNIKSYNKALNRKNDKLKRGMILELLKYLMKSNHLKSDPLLHGHLPKYLLQTRKIESDYPTIIDFIE